MNCQLPARPVNEYRPPSQSLGLYFRRVQSQEEYSALESKAQLLCSDVAYSYSDSKSYYHHVECLSESRGRYRDPEWEGNEMVLRDRRRIKMFVMMRVVDDETSSDAEVFPWASALLPENPHLGCITLRRLRSIVEQHQMSPDMRVVVSSQSSSLAVMNGLRRDIVQASSIPVSAISPLVERQVWGSKEKYMHALMFVPHELTSAVDEYILK